MNRRVMIKGLTLVSGSILFLPSCLHQEEKKKAAVQLNNLSLDSDQEQLLAEIAETIIPTTDSAGAKALGLPQFVWTMVDDCYAKDDQEAFLKGLDQVEEMADQKFGRSFIKCTTEQRHEVLFDLEANKGQSEAQFFYTIAKGELIKGYLNSKLVMTQFRKYELVPGRYDGYFPVEKA